jgi:choloylglycine hydrolase
LPLAVSNKPSPLRPDYPRPPVLIQESEDEIHFSGDGIQHPRDVTKAGLVRIGIRNAVKFTVFVPLVLAGTLLPGDASACTTFCLERKGSVVFGKNYDFGIGYGMLVVNKRGVSKTALVDPPNRAARWIARYGSLTFNQFGREFPSGGMNEAGLAVELMWLDAAEYPKPDSRPAVGVLEWIQYQLDNFATAAEVVANAEKIRIASRTPLHYLVADRAGGCASVEFLEGKLVAHQGAALPARALTNDTYETSLAYLRDRERSGARALPDGPGSLARFVRAATLVRASPGRAAGSAVDDAFRVLESAANPNATQWSIAWDLSNLRLHFRTRSNRRLRTVSLAAFDLSCRTPVRTADVDGEPVFADYSATANRALIERSYRGVDFLRATPGRELDAAAAYPESTSCVR